jgi:streptogramin lyase
VVSFGFSAWIIDTATNTVITTIPLDVPNICGIAMAEVPDIAPTPRPTETATPTAEPHPTPSPRPCSTQRARAARSTDTAQFREFEVPYVPGGITAGPDGNIWFTEYFGMRIDRLTLDGAVTAFPIPESASVAEGISTGITVGPEGNLWFTIGNAIGRMTLEGTFTVFPLPSGSSSPTGITLGPDGNLWFTESNIGQVGRITPQGKITEFPSTLATQPMAIVSGPDGNLWFTEAELPISSGQTAG